MWIQDFGNVFGLGFTLEGFSFFLEAHLHRDLRLRLGPALARAHFLLWLRSRSPAHRSLFVIAVNGWMNHPSGFTPGDGRAADVRPWSALFANPMFWTSRAYVLRRLHRVGFLLAGAYAWALLRGRPRAVRADGARPSPCHAASVAAPLQVIAR